MHAADVLRLVEELGDTPYGMEPVDQRAHALQAAGHALSAGATDELVVAALLHDIARHPEVRRQHPRLPHEVAGRAWAAPLFGERVAWLIGSHVPAKRWLVGTDPSYASTLSAESQHTLGLQGGPMDGAEAEAFEKEALFTEAVLLRRWDDAAKVAGAPEPSGAELLSVLSRILRPAP